MNFSWLVQLLQAILPLVLRQIPPGSPPRTIIDYLVRIVGMFPPPPLNANDVTVLRAVAQAQRVPLPPLPWTTESLESWFADLSLHQAKADMVPVQSIPKQVAS